MDHSNPPRRSLCIVSRDPVLCSALVLSLQASVDPDEEVEIILDRRRERGVFEASSAAPDRGLVDRRQSPHVDLEVKTKGFAVVTAAPTTPRPLGQPDADDDRARFENILSFRRGREARSGRVLGAAGAVMVALILSPSLGGLFDRGRGEAPSSTEMTQPESSAAALRSDQAHRTGATRAPVVSGPPSNSSAPGNALRARANPPAARATGARPQKAKHGAIETYAARVEDATGRIVSKAKGLIDRVKSDVIGNAPISIGLQPSSDDDRSTAGPNPTNSP